MTRPTNRPFLDDTYFGCKAKALFHSEHSAQKFADKQRRKNKRLRLEPYKCDHCGKYHLTGH